jgi:hypothetical protein
MNAEQREHRKKHRLMALMLEKMIFEDLFGIANSGN